jgi:hypothetical protein
MPGTLSRKLMSHPKTDTDRVEALAKTDSLADPVVNGTLSSIFPLSVSMIPGDHSNCHHPTPENSRNFPKNPTANSRNLPKNGPPLCCGNFRQFSDIFGNFRLSGRFLAPPQTCPFVLDQNPCVFSRQIFFSFRTLHSPLHTLTTAHFNCTLHSALNFRLGLLTPAVLYML